MTTFQTPPRAFLIQAFLSFQARLCQAKQHLSNNACLYSVNKSFSSLCRLAYCSISNFIFAALTSALRSNFSHMRELNLSDNEPRALGLKSLCDLLQDPNSKLEKLQWVFISGYTNMLSLSFTFSVVFVVVCWHTRLVYIFMHTLWWPSSAHNKFVFASLEVVTSAYTVVRKKLTRVN